MLVGFETFRFPFLSRDRDRNQFVCETLGLRCGGSPLVAAECKLVLVVSSDFEHRGEILCSLTHDEFGQWAVESIAIHSIDKMMVAHSQTPSRLLDKIRHIAHRLGSARDGNRGVA